MAMVQGTVEKVNAKPLASGRDAGKLSFSFKLAEGQQWYGCYTNDPKVAVGECISFDAKANGEYVNCDIKTIKRLENSNGAASNSNVVPVGAGGAGAAAPVKNMYDTRQAAIQFQASRNAAIAVLELAQACGAVKLPAKESDKLDALLALVDEITVRYDKATTEACEQPGV
jgi:hypothetical protein